MQIVLQSISDKGDLQNERIGLKVKTKTNLKFFLLFKTYFQKDSDNFYNQASQTYWFAPQEVNVGDKVVVYTRKGVNKSIVNDDGTTTYFVYWKLEEPIFINDNGIVLVEITSWDSSKSIK